MALKYKTWLLVLVLLCFSSSVFAQDNPPSKSSTESEQTVKIDTTLVNIPVIAVDKKGGFLSDLKAEDFVVYENGVKQKIELFSAENAPANILIMMEKRLILNCVPILVRV